MKRYHFEIVLGVAFLAVFPDYYNFVEFRRPGLSRTEGYHR